MARTHGPPVSRCAAFVYVFNESSFHCVAVQIYVGDSPRSWINGELCYENLNPFTGPGYRINATCVATGRYLSVVQPFFNRGLELCEVQVRGPFHVEF
jgi:hypothetical protein